MINLLPHDSSNSRPDEVKFPVTRQNGTVEWVNSTSNGTGQPNPDRSGQGR
jgi:peptide-N4-(N-acetyl-beta-glucosaminyl)asparagine amidase